MRGLFVRGVILVLCIKTGLCGGSAAVDSNQHAQAAVNTAEKLSAAAIANEKKEKVFMTTLTFPPLPSNIARDPALTALLKSWYVAGYNSCLYELNKGTNQGPMCEGVGIPSSTGTDESAAGTAKDMHKLLAAKDVGVKSSLGAEEKPIDEKKELPTAEVEKEEEKNKGGEPPSSISTESTESGKKDRAKAEKVPPKKNACHGTIIRGIKANGQPITIYL